MGVPDWEPRLPACSFLVERLEDGHHYALKQTNVASLPQNIRQDVVNEVRRAQGRGVSCRIGQVAGSSTSAAPHLSQATATRLPLRCAGCWPRCGTTTLCSTAKLIWTATRSAW